MTAPTNGSVSSTSGSTGKTANYSCNTGYAIFGANPITCNGVANSNSTWSNNILCVAKYCPTLIPPTFGNVSRTFGFTGQTANYSCNTGYSISGTNPITCNGVASSNSTWSAVIATCTAKPCPTLTAPTNGAVSSTSGSTGQTANYSCNTGYSFSGTNPITCNGVASSSSTWSAAAATCTAKPCPTLTAPTNGSVSRTSGSTGQIATYSCNTGYSVFGANPITCNGVASSDSTWSAAAATCIANPCTSTQVAFSNKAALNSISGVTAVAVIVTCNAGYSGGGTATCGTGGTFNTLTCRANTCTCPSGTATVATGTGGTLCEANNTVDCSACNPGFNLSSSAGVGLQYCIGELCCFVLVHIYYDSCDHIVLL